MTVLAYSLLQVFTTHGVYAMPMCVLSTHSFPNGGLLLVIESEGNQEHIVDADVIFTYRAEPETRA